MNIPKEMVVERVRARGDAELLRGLDVDPADLVEEFGGQSPEVG